LHESAEKKVVDARHKAGHDDLGGCDALPPQHRDHAIGEGQALGHHGNEIGQELLAERWILGLDGFELVGAQHVENARDFGLDHLRGFFS
jgi:hypothetical protein